MSASTDHGTVIDSGECAMITMGGMKEIGLLVPGDEHLPDGQVPKMMLFVSACAVRGMKDPDFFQEQIDWFMSQRSH
jgi:hypothetical protein